MTSNFSGYTLKEYVKAIPLHVIKSGKRITGRMPRSSILKSAQLIDTWKVLIPAAGSDGGQKIPDAVLGAPLIASSPSACTQSYLFFFIDSEMGARSIESYLRTRFFRFLVSLRKNTQHATRATYTWVPQQKWTKTWTDAELYKKYDITKKEQAHIESMIKEMAQ